MAHGTEQNSPNSGRAGGARNAGLRRAPLSGEVVSRPRTRPVREVDDDPSPDDVERFNNVTQTCPHCGKEVFDDVDVCYHCGLAIGSGVGRKAPLWILVVVVVLVAGFVLARVL